jgi:enoyl-CoA hydratase
MNYENIIVAMAEGIVTITFNRPKALNALNSALLEELSAAVDDIAQTAAARVLILTGPVTKPLLPVPISRNWRP